MRSEAPAAQSRDVLLKRFETLNEIGVALSSERDLKRLLELILEAARKFANADGGTLYRVHDNHLVFEVLRNDTLGFCMGGKTGKHIDFAPLPLYDKEGNGNHTMVVAHAALTGETVNIPDAYSAVGFDFSGTRAFDAKTGYRSKSFLTIPMKNSAGEVIGVLQLINSRSDDGSTVDAFSEAEQQLVESLASQAAIALSNRLLSEQQENLFESLISLINSAIDEKSPYTGGHCERVPMLTMMLAEAVDRSAIGPLSDFKMTDADRYELKIAGLLHDCGKITTPVHVVDKATKLQTLFDRIELIDTRFEVLQRDLEIARLKGEINDEEHARQSAAILVDREAVRVSNVGAEFMPDAQLAVIQNLAKRTWQPVGESPRPFLSADELENLSIRKGTLTRAEREIINHHIAMTIKMLEALPWPKHLLRVPEYAGGHHERMDGKGYPRGLKREEMSVQARVMGIADIFEALTAGDRPYKLGKPLSESIRILGLMMQDNHIDADLFEIFLRERVYMRYAKRFLPPQQIDRIDWAKIPGLSAPLREFLTEADSGR